MTKANDLASLLDANGDVVSSALDNVPASDLVNDTTPQLGGNLDLNSNNITGTGNLDVTGTVDISNSSGATLKLTSTDVTGADTELLGQIDFVSSDSSGGSAGTQARIKGVYEDNGDSSGIAFLTGNSTGSGSPTINEVMRLRHEGTVLVGKTSAGYNVDGFETHQNGETYVSRSGTPVAINRNSSDGTLLNLYKDGSTVGSIGSRAGVASYIVLDPRNATGNGGSGLTGVGAVIRPTNYTGGQTDNHVSLGSSAARFNNLYLSGGVYLGGTGSANLLHYYEEGAWNPALNGGLTPSIYQASFTVIGNRVFLTCNITVPTNSINSAIIVSGLPYSTLHDGSGALSYTNAQTTNDFFILVQGSQIYFYKGIGATNYLLSDFSGKLLRFTAQYNINN